MTLTWRAQELYDHFWADMENRVRDEGVVVRLSKWMRELEQTFYGSSAAYDTAVAADAAAGALQSALRRNMFMGEGQPADAARAARYVRYQLACLALTPSEAVMAGAFRRDRGRGARLS
jgi:cytochrome b pre-mRNA-processing protein 3